MTLLVTGGAGFIGSNFVLDWLAQSDEPVVNLDALTYARVDLIRGHDGAPQLLELELCEPSLFFEHAAGSADRFASVLAHTLKASAGTGRHERP